MDKFIIFEYIGSITASAFGWYLRFSDQDSICKKVLQKIYHLPNNEYISGSDRTAMWKDLICKCFNYKVPSCSIVGRCFPEFSSKSDLYKFIDFLCFKNSTPFINLKLVLSEVW